AALHTTGGTFEIHNTVIFNNGSSSLQTSPVFLEAGTGTFTFNTVTRNSVRGNGPGGFASGVECGSAMPIPGNIIVGNLNRAHTTTCDTNLSRTNGTGADVMWRVFPPAQTSDLHLTPTSPTRNVPGLDCSTVSTDMDGEPRPMPVGTTDHCDQGADEF